MSDNVMSDNVTSDNVIMKPNYVDNIVMEKDDIFECIKIMPGKISEVNWFDTNYALNLTKLDLFESFKMNRENFIEMLSVKLNVDNFKEIKNMSVKNEIIAEEPEFLYELLYINLDKNSEFQKEEHLNEMATLLNTNGDMVYYNALLFKNHISSLSNSMVLVDMIKSDITRILDSRVNTMITTCDDGEWKEVRVQGDLNNFAADFFDDSKIYKMEIGFLMHNINIWYTLFDNYGKYLCGDLINKKMDKCIVFSMKSEEYRGNITLDEVKKIIYLSGKLKDYNTPSHYTEEKRDDLGRKIVYSKYKVLDLVHSNNC